MSSNVKEENPGVSATIPPHSNFKSSACLVVCFPLFILSLTSPVCNLKFGSISFSKLDLPTPDGPAKTTTLLFNSSFILSIFSGYMEEAL